MVLHLDLLSLAWDGEGVRLVLGEAAGDGRNLRVPVIRERRFHAPRGLGPGDVIVIRTT
jgi:hypothetical protein